MKKEKSKGMLSLNKETITNLNKLQMNEIKGGSSAPSLISRPTSNLSNSACSFPVYVYSIFHIK